MRRDGKLGPTTRDPTGRYPSRCDSGLESHSHATTGAERRIWLGWKDYSARDGPHPFGAVHGASKPTTAQSDQPRRGATDNAGRYTEHRGRYPSTSPQNAKSPPAGGLLRCVAGVEGFEPPNGGIKTRCLTTWRHPSNFKSPPCAAPRAQAKHSAHAQRNSSSDQAPAPQGAQHRSR